MYDISPVEVLLITYVVLAILPTGWPALLGFLAFVVMICIWLYNTYTAYPGTDYAYYDHYLVFGIQILAAAGGIAGLAQLWRYWCFRTGRRSYYSMIVIGSPIGVMACLWIYTLQYRIY